MNDFNDEVHQSSKQVTKVPVEGNDPILALSTLVGILKGSRHVTRGGGSRAPVHVTTLPVLDWHNGSRDTSVTRD